MSLNAYENSTEFAAADSILAEMGKSGDNGAMIKALIAGLPANKCTPAHRAIANLHANAIGARLALLRSGCPVGVTKKQWDQKNRHGDAGLCRLWCRTCVLAD